MLIFKVFRIDVAAKEGIQETFVTILGMLLGMGFTAWIGESKFIIWMVFIFLTIGTLCYFFIINFYIFW